METFKKISVNVSTSIIKSIEDDGENVVEIINNLLKDYVNNNKKIKEEELRIGYEQMGEINLGLAKMCLEADNEALLLTEHYFTESE